MSMKAMLWALEQQVGNSTRKLILVKLADNANEATGICWPSLKTIGRVAECDKSTVTRHIKALADMNLLSIIHRRDGETNLSNMYRLHLPQSQSATSENEGF